MKTLHEAAAKSLAVLDSFALHTPEILSGPDYETATELRSALKRSTQQVAVPEGNWLWCKLMDFCKKRGYSPADFDDLFAIGGEARHSK